MKQKLFLLFALILAVAQGWTMPVDSLRIGPHTTSIPNNWNGVELADGNELVNGFKPFTNPDVFDGTSGYTSSSDSWSSIPSTKTFKTKVGKPVTYTFTLSYCYYRTSNLGLIPDNPPKARLIDETGMFSIDETCTYVTQHVVTITDTDGFSHSYTCEHFIRKVTVTYTPSERGTHSAKLKIQHAVCVYGFDHIINGFKTIKLAGTATDPSISVSPSSLTFSDATVGETYTKSLMVTGTDLSWADNLRVSSSNSNFIVSPSTITAADAAAGKIVTVTYKPTATGTHVGTITISTLGATSKTVSVKGTCTTSAAPTINTNVTAFTFGTVIKGNTATKTFTVTGSNLTGSLAVSSSNSNFTVSPTTLPASGGTVTVTYKPTTEGSHSATITISGGGATSKTVTATGMCVVPNITTTSSSLAFGTVLKGNTSSKTFKVWGTHLTGSLTLSSSNSNFKVSPTTISADEAAEGKTITVTYNPSAAGSHSGTITISGGGAASKTVSVSGTCVIPNITVSVSSLAFGNVVKGNTASKTITVTTSNLTGSLTVSSNNSNFVVSPTTLPASGGTVTVTYKPTAPGSHSATITISCGATSVTFIVTGTCLDPAIFSTSVSSLAFGTVIKGNSSTKTFTVTGSNLTGSLTLSSNNSNFTVNPTTITAAQAAAGKTVTVTYKPTAAGSHSATITISGGGAASKTVSVTGKCVVPTITVSETSLLFAGYNDSRTFKVTGTNLTGSLTVSSNSSYFAVSPTTISVTEAKAGKTVLVHCVAATNVQHATGTITISGGGASPKIVRVSLDTTGNVPYANLVEPENEPGDVIYGGEIDATTNNWGNSTTGVHELMQEAKIYPEGKNIIIESPVEQSAVISDIAGRVRRVNLQAGRNEIPVNASGIYIVGIREKTAKLMIK